MAALKRKFLFDEVMEKIMLQQIQIEKIKKEHTLMDFKSYNKDLEKFLREDALHNQEQTISLTFLWFYKSQLASYITLLTDRITLNANLQRTFQKKGIHYHTSPALKIGRLCVHDNFLKRGLGTLMVYFAIDQARAIADQRAGCRFLTVDAKRDSLLFYQKLGFTILMEEEKNTIPLYFDHRRALHET